MALVRITALKDFRNTALSTTDVSTGFNLGTTSAVNNKIYAGLHLTSASLGTTARVLAMTLQSASSSGFGAQTAVASFALSTVQGAEWAVPVVLSTDRPWYRASWVMSTTASTGGTWKGLTWVGIK